jgi:putative lipase involved disintegration of autophagic bodies
MYLKYILVIFSFFVFFSQSLSAEQKETNQDAINALVRKVKTVEPSQRRVLMNELKVMLRSMHQETRKQVMLDLRRSFSANTGSQTRNHSKQSNMHHQTTMSMTESKHMQEHMTQSNMIDRKPPAGHTPPSGNRPSVPNNPQKPQNTPMRGM